MWETIKTMEESENDCSSSSRLKVPHGWIVRTIVLGAGNDSGVSCFQTFIQDDNHEWKLEE